MKDGSKGLPELPAGKDDFGKVSVDMASFPVVFLNVFATAASGGKKGKRG